MSALNATPIGFVIGIDVSGGQAGLGLIVIFCIAAIWAAAGHPHREHGNKPNPATTKKD